MNLTVKIMNRVNHRPPEFEISLIVFTGMNLQKRIVSFSTNNNVVQDSKNENTSLMVHEARSSMKYDNYTAIFEKCLVPGKNVRMRTGNF